MVNIDLNQDLISWRTDFSLGKTVHVFECVCHQKKQSEENVFDQEPAIKSPFRRYTNQTLY